MTLTPLILDQLHVTFGHIGALSLILFIVIGVIILPEIIYEILSKWWLSLPIILGILSLTMFVLAAFCPELPQVAHGP